MLKASNLKIISLVLLEEIREILCFPLWWYSQGFLKVLKGSLNFIKDFEQTLGFTIWVKNLFVPMFGQRDFSGRLISFFLRVFQIFWKGLVMIMIIAIAFVFILFWLILPIIIIYQIAKSL